MRSFAASSFVAIALLLPALVSAESAATSHQHARPEVTLTLTGSVLGRGADGRPTMTPVEKVALKSGDEIAYDIAAANAGGAAAVHLVGVGKIPAGTSYIGGSAKSAHARVEFSLDGGKTWSTTPMIKVKRSDGTIVLKKADPSLYTTIRFVAAGALAPHAGDMYTYEVRVK